GARQPLGCGWGRAVGAQGPRAGLRPRLAGEGADRATGVRVLLHRGVQAARPAVAVRVRDVLRQPRPGLVAGPGPDQPRAGRGAPDLGLGDDRLGTVLPAAHRAEGYPGGGANPRRRLPRRDVLHPGGRALRALLAGVLPAVRPVG